MAIKEINELIGKKIELSDEEKREAAWNGFLSDIDNIKKEVASFWVEKEGIIGLSDDVLKIIKDNKEMAEGVFLDFDEKIKSIDQHCDFEINQDLALSMSLTLLRDALVQVDDNTSFDHTKGLILKNVESISDLKKRKEFKNRLNDILSRATNRGGREGGVDSIKELYSDISEEIKNQKGKVGGKAESAKSTNTEVDINDKKILFPAMIRTFKNDFIGAIEDKNPSFGKKATDLIQKLKDKGDGIGFRELSKSFSQLSEILVGRGVLTQEEVDGFLEKNKVIEKGMEEKRLQNIEEKKEEKRLQNKAVAEKGVDAASGDIVDDKMDDSGSIEGEASDSLDAGGAVDVKTESGTAELMSSDKLDDLEEGSTDKEGGGEVVEDVLEDDSAESGDAVVNPEVADFFNQFKTTYLSGDESEEEKERIIGEIEESSRQIQELLSSEDTPKNHKDYVEGMNFLLDHYSRAIYNSLTNYEGFLEEGKKEAEKKDSEFVELFKEVAEKLFVDIKKPTSHSEIQNRIHELTSQSFEYPVIPHIFSDLNSVSSDKEEFVKKLGVHMQSIGDLGASLKSDNQEAAESTERQILECQKVVYELTLMRDFLQNEEGEDFEAEEKLTKEEIDALLSNEPRGDSGDEEISLGATEADVDAEAKAEAEAEILDYRDEIGKIKDEMMGWINEITDKGYAETLQRKINAMWKETESLDLHKQGPKEWKDKLEEWKAERDHKNKQIDERGIRGGSADRKGADDHEPAKVGASDGADTSSSVDLGVSDKGDIDGADDKDILDIDDVVAVTDKSNTESGDVVEGKDIVSVNGKKEREYKKAQRVNLTEEEKKESVDAGFSTVDMKIEKMLSSDVVYGYKEFFGISEADLRHIEGFGELSEGQQLLVLENLKQLTLGRIKDEAVEEHQKGIKKFVIKEKDEDGKNVERGAKGIKEYAKNSHKILLNTLSNVRKSLFKNFRIVRNEQILVKDVAKGGMEVHGDVLSHLVSGMNEVGLDVEKDKDGKLNIGYFSQKDFEDLNQGDRDKIDNLNKVANKFGKIPYEWSQESTASKSEYKEFLKAKNEYDEAKKEVFNIKSRESGPLAAASFINDRELRIELNKFFSNHPDIEKEFQSIKSPLVWKRAFSGIFEKGGYMSVGFISRTATVKLAGAVFLPLTAMLIGGWKARSKANQTIRETKMKARRGVEDEKFRKNVEDYVDAEYLHESINDLMDILDEAEGSKKSDKRRTEALKSLRFHLEDAQNKLEDGTVNFGGIKEAAYNQYKLVSQLSKGFARVDSYAFFGEEYGASGREVVDLGVYYEYEKDKVDNSKFNFVGTRSQYEADLEAIKKLLKSREDAASEEERGYKTREMLKGAGMAAAFSAAGALFREYGLSATKEAIGDAYQEASVVAKKIAGETKHALDNIGIHIGVDKPLDLNAEQIKEYGVNVVDDLDGDGFASNEEIVMAQAREFNIDKEKIGDIFTIKKPLSAEDLNKLRYSGITDPRVIGAIMKNGVISGDDMEIKIAQSGLSSDNAYRIIENPAFTDRIGKIVDNPAFGKLEPGEKNMLINLCFDGKDGPMNYDVANALSRIKDYTEDVWKIIRPNEAAAGTMNTGNGVSRMGISLDDLKKLQEIAIEQDTAFETVANGDSLTDIAERILLADNAGEDLREAFVKEHLGSDIDYVNGDKVVLLDEAIKKMSRSNVGPNFGDGKDVNNLIYEGNRIGIDRETGKFVYQKADGVYASRAVSEKTLADNAREIYGDKHGDGHGRHWNEKAGIPKNNVVGGNIDGSLIPGEALYGGGAVYFDSAKDLAAIHELQEKIASGNTELNGLREATRIKIFEGENGHNITDREYNGYDDRVFGVGERGGEVVGGGKVQGIKDMKIGEFLKNGPDRDLYPNAEKFQGALRQRMGEMGIKPDFNSTQKVGDFIDNKLIGGDERYKGLSEAIRENKSVLDGLVDKRSKGLLDMRINDVMKGAHVDNNNSIKIKEILTQFSKGTNSGSVGEASMITDSSPVIANKMLAMGSVPNQEIIGVMNKLSGLNRTDAGNLLDAYKANLTAFPKVMSVGGRIDKILEMDKIPGASYKDKVLFAIIEANKGEGGGLKEKVTSFINEAVMGNGKVVAPENVKVSFNNGVIKISVDDDLDKNLVMEMGKKGGIRTYREGWLNSDVSKFEESKTGGLAGAKARFANMLRAGDGAVKTDVPQEATNNGVPAKTVKGGGNGREAMGKLRTDINDLKGAGTSKGYSRGALFHGNEVGGKGVSDRVGPLSSPEEHGEEIDEEAKRILDKPETFTKKLDESVPNNNDASKTEKTALNGTMKLNDPSGSKDYSPVFKAYGIKNGRGGDINYYDILEDKRFTSGQKLAALKELIKPEHGQVTIDDGISEKYWKNDGKNVFYRVQDSDTWIKVQ